MLSKKLSFQFSNKRFRRDFHYLILALLIVSVAINLFQYLKPAASSLKKMGSLIISAHVVKVIDGDTVDTENGERLRLYDINAPEYPKGCMGENSKTRLEELVLDKNITFEPIKRDNFGRILAYVYLDDQLVNEVLVEEGLAYYYQQVAIGQNSLKIENAQNKARQLARGVWSTLCQTKKEGCLIKGNYRQADNTRIYHTPDCYNYDKITIRNGTSDRWFCTEEEAVEAGFRKSLDCPK